MMAIKNYISSFSRSLLLAVVCLFSAQFSWATISSYTPSTATYLKNTYYSNLNNKSGATLFSAVVTATGGVAHTYTKLTYDELYTAYYTSDVYPSGHANAGKLWDMYSTVLWVPGAKECGNYSVEGDCYNREHSMPKSWFGGSSNYKTTNQGCDLVHLVPTDGFVNSKRSNYAFGEVKTTSYTSNGGLSKLGSSETSLSVTESTISGTSVSGISATVFEPADEYKGDFARIYMYMRARYSTLNLAQADGGTVHFSSTTNAANDSKYGFKDYSVILLMKWHREDPVSQKEIDRNNQIEIMQGNRNPFVDYPCLAEYLWGSKAGQTFNTSNVIGSFESGFVTTGDGCDGCSTSCSSSSDPTITLSTSSLTMDATAVNGTSTKTFTVTGANLIGAISISKQSGGSSFISISPSSSISSGYNGTTTITVTYSPTSTGTHIATFTFSSSNATSKTITITGTCATVYTATWMANSSQFHQNTAASGSAPDMPSDTPDDCSGSGGKKFVGWTAHSSVSGSVPDDLFTSSAPTITSNTTFYAVYADKAVSTTTTTATFAASDISATPANGSLSWTHTASGITLTLSAGQRYTNGTPNTFTVTKGESNYAQLSGDKTITQVVATISGINYKINSVSPGSLSTSSTTQSITGINNTSVTMYATSDNQIRLTQLVVTYYPVTYSNYSLTCSTVSCTTSPALNAATVGSVTSSGATVNCAGITSLGSAGCTITSYGFVYGTTSYPTLSNTQAQVGTSYTTTGTSFSTSLTGLSASTTYYVRSYATNGNGTSYGSQASFTTSAPTSYTVTFMNNGATYATKSGYAGATITGVTDPTPCDGYTFVGWSTSQATTETTTSPTIDYTGTIPSANTTYYAVFSRTEGSGSSSTVTDDITLTTTGVTSGSTTYSNWASTGTSGAGYSGNSAGGNASIQMRSNNSNSGIVTTTSGGTASNITVTWLSNTGNNNRTVNVYGKNTAYTAASDLYSTNTQGTLLGSAVYGASTSIDVSGSYSYIGLRSNSGALYLTNIAVTWSTSGGSTTYYTTSPNCTPTTYNLTVSATPSGYGTVSQNSVTGIPSGSAVTTNNNTFTVNGTTVTATPTTATAQYTYSFSTWNNLPSTVTADVDNVQAVFTRTTNTYTVTFDANGHGTAPSAQTGIEYGSKATQPTAPTATGYTFGGWYKEAGCTNQWNFSSDVVTDNITLYAKWTAKSYTITYKDQGNATFTGTNENALPSSHTYGTTTTLVDATKTGYTFGGWFTNSNCTGSAVTSLGATAYTSNITLYAKWTINTYNFTIGVNNSSYGSVSRTSITGIPYGSTVTINGNQFTVNGTTVTATPATQTAQYTYTFNNWSNLPSTVTANVTNVTANFTRTLRSYTVTFQDNLGNTLNTQTVNYGSGATAPNIPTIDCYTHGTWDKAYNNITGDLTVTVTYTKIQYEITAEASPSAGGTVSVVNEP